MKSAIPYGNDVVSTFINIFTLVHVYHNLKSLFSFTVCKLIAKEKNLFYKKKKEFKTRENITMITKCYQNLKLDRPLPFQLIWCSQSTYFEIWNKWGISRSTVVLNICTCKGKINSTHFDINYKDFMHV